MQSSAIEQGKQASGVNPHQPIRLCPAQSRPVKPRKIFARLEVGKTLPDSGLLHTADPKPLYGLAASGQVINAPENKLALTSGVAGVYDIFNITSAQQLFKDFKLAYGAFRNRHSPAAAGQNRQILPAPFGIILVVNLRRSQPGKIVNAPANQPTCSPR